jgi:hypothetical protein
VPTEIRHIIFSSEELFVALKDYRKRRREPLPTGSVVKFTLEQVPALSVAVRIAPDTGEPERVFVANRDELATALIMYCIDNKIPMPVKSTKFLQIFGGSLGLVITKNLSTEQIEPIEL